MRLIASFAGLWLIAAGFIIWDKLPKPSNEAETQCTAWIADPLYVKLRDSL